MKIVNPLYDYAFKYLMQNNRLAKKVIATLLECEVLELVIEQQETVIADESRGFKMFRLDFSAIIVNEYGKKQKVLIELQKSKLPTNKLRFRTYLGESYLKKETFVNELGEEASRIYPIISIYILGYNVVDIPYLAISIDNKITNIVTKEEVEVQSDFVDLLTHKTKVIQIRRLSKERRTKLEQFLSLFDQAQATLENRFILELQEIPKGFDDIVKYLSSAVYNEEVRRNLRGEQEIDEIFRNQEAQLAQAEERAEKAELKMEEVKRQAAEATQQRKAMQIQLAKYMLKNGASTSEIIQQTGLTSTEIANL